MLRSSPLSVQAPARGTQSPAVSGAQVGGAGGQSALVPLWSVAWEAGVCLASCRGPGAFSLQQATPNAVAQNLRPTHLPVGRCSGRGSAGLSLHRSQVAGRRPQAAGCSPSIPRPSPRDDYCAGLPPWPRSRCPVGQTGCVSV
uniref:Uncharacterized protein n=1 Tax=Rousettus aegyptiacus TaxID=9407 RepID=A0A7J8D6I4_ROUAE|nr:hypothetical protein HJG63_008819 [Rousettus aegyptiacus]